MCAYSAHPKNSEGAIKSEDAKKLQKQMLYFV